LTILPHEPTVPEIHPLISPAEPVQRISPAVYLLALGSILLHIAVNIWSPYGFHRDEFLYIAMGTHLRLWQMDFPPFIGIAANITRAMLGESLAAVRFFPPIAGAILMFLSADIARRFGGKSFAQILAALAVLLSPVFLRPGNLFQPVVFDQLWWTLGCWVIIRWRQTADSRWWAVLGVVMGVGLLTKFSIGFFAVGTLTGLLATQHRRILLTRWPWIALGLMLLIGSPSIVGQFMLGFPVVGEMRALQSVQLTHVSAFDFLSQQLLILGPPTLAIALAGVVVLLTSRRFVWARILGWTFVGSFAMLFFLHGKAYYIAPIYPAMIGAGAAVIELVAAGYKKILFRSAVMVLVLAFGLFAMPFGLPVLPPAQMARYGAAVGIGYAVKTNTGVKLQLPQDYADLLGWEERVAELSRVYQSLTAEQRAQAVILASNYGEAGAIDFLGPRSGLPHSVCAHGTYWFFGPGEKPGLIALAIGFDESDLQENWRRVTAAAHIENELTVPEEQHLTIYLCEDEIRPIQELWPLLGGRF